MGFEYLTNVPLVQAKADYLKLLQDRGYGHRTEMIPVWDACGRVTARAVYAHICAPHDPLCGAHSPLHRHMVRPEPSVQALLRKLTHKPVLASSN